MRAVIQRVLSASVQVVARAETNERANFDTTQEGADIGDGSVAGVREAAEIGPGYLVLIGVKADDSVEDARLLADKTAHLRVWEDEAGKLNHSILEVQGSVLVVSNFTLYADCRKGRRPSFTEAGKGETAEALYRAFGVSLAGHGVAVRYGVFGAEMRVSLVNDGPVTLLLDSRRVF